MIWIEQHSCILHISIVYRKKDVEQRILGVCAFYRWITMLNMPRPKHALSPSGDSADSELRRIHDLLTSFYYHCHCVLLYMQSRLATGLLTRPVVDGHQPFRNITRDTR